MSLENRSISLLRSMMPLSPALQNGLMESDSEILNHPGGQLLFSMDEFSAEDLFREDDFYSLGWNCAAGAVSDILACGGKPLYYAHSVTAARHWTDANLKDLSRGMGDVLRLTGAGLIGGDFGRAADWRISASVIGTPGVSTLKRTSARPGELLYLTGRAGAGNLEAALHLYSSNPALGLAGRPLRNRFVPRMAESGLAARFATACMDTSDGLYQTVLTLAELNRTGFELNSIPVNRYGLWLSRLLGLPSELLVLAECGEYELLMTIDPRQEDAFLAAAASEKLRLTRIGRLTEDPGCLRWNQAGRLLDLSALTIRARDFESPAVYLKKLTQWLEENQCAES